MLAHLKEDGNVLRIFQRIILRRICGCVSDNGVWRIRYDSEIYTLYDESDMVKVVKIGRLWWLGHVFTMQELDPCRKLTIL